MSKMLSIAEASKLLNTSTVAIYKRLGRLRKKDKEVYRRVTKKVNKVIFVDVDYLRNGTPDIEKEESDTTSTSQGGLVDMIQLVNNLRKDISEMDARHTKQIEAMQLRAEEQQKYLNTQIVGLSKMLSDGGQSKEGTGEGVPATPPQDGDTPIQVEAVSETSNFTSNQTSNIVKKVEAPKWERLIFLTVLILLAFVLFFVIWKFRGSF
jgi:hypothetical protein